MAADETAADGGPALIGANTYDFRPGERIDHGLVASACLVWVLRGRGLVRTDGLVIELTTGMAMCLPWRHAVRYDADPVNPFRVGTVHIVPRHAPSATIVPLVPHTPGDPMLDDPLRSGETGRAVVIPDAERDAGRLLAIGRFAVDRMNAGLTDVGSLRALGELLADEMGRATRDVVSGAERAPDALVRMREWIDEHLDRRFTVDEVAAAGGCSASTAVRLFSRWTGRPVLAWATERRMERAATLLATTGLRVNEVAAALGYADPLYFSRTFRKVHGVPPTRYGSGTIRP
jgi:AraC-like DNA-binding protein